MSALMVTLRGLLVRAFAEVTVLPGGDSVAIGLAGAWVAGVRSRGR